MCTNCIYHWEKKFNDDLEVMRSGYSKLNDIMKQTIDEYRNIAKRVQTGGSTNIVKRNVTIYLTALFHADVITMAEHKELLLYATYDNKYMYCSPTKEGE
jgi:hypothetical protein